MANEIQIALEEAGLTVYAAVRRKNGDFWSLVDGWKPITEHTTYWTNARILLTEQIDTMPDPDVSSGDYYGNMPSLPADTYTIEIWEQPPGTTGAADRTFDRMITSTPMYWTGTELLVYPSKCV